MAFIVSRTEGALGARIVFGLLGGFAAIAFYGEHFHQNLKNSMKQGIVTGQQKERLLLKKSL